MALTLQHQHLNGLYQMKETDAAYIAGLFDGEGSVYYVRRTEKKKKHTGKGHRQAYCWRISMEITMTDQSVLRWVHEVLGCGTFNHKPRKGLRKDGTPYLKQYKWRCTFRDAYYVCCMLWPIQRKDVIRMKIKEKDYEDIYWCIVTDQVPAEIINEYFEDKNFYRYYIIRRGKDDK